MSVENQEVRTVEVLGVPEGVDEELLTLYFTNKRRSGGGPLTSLEKVESRALLVFEEAEAAASVLSKRPHVLRNVELTVRKPALKDPGRLLLCGVNPTTSTDMMELYVENMLGLEVDDYSLERLERDLVFIRLHQPFCKDFQQISMKISKKLLDGCSITLEQIDQTDSILVANLHPSINKDILILYFESKRGGGGEVKEVTMMADGTARVSFEDFESVDHVLKLPHKLEDCELTVKPYFAFLQSEESVSSQCSSNGTLDRSPSTDSSPSIAGNIQRRDSAGQLHSSSPIVTSASDQTSHQTALEPPVTPPSEQEGGAEEIMEVLAEEVKMLSTHIPVPDPLKLNLFRISSLAQDLQRAHPGLIQIEDNGVHISGPEKPGLDLLRSRVLEFLGGIAQAHLTFDLQKAQFLGDEEVKVRLQQTLKDQGTPCIYTVTDRVVAVMSPSLSLASQACSSLKSLISEFNIPVDRTYECMLYSQEWSAFLQSLNCCSAKVSERGGQIDVLTLKGMEDEKQTKIVEFLSTPIERETIIAMELGMLKYIQLHCHQLLADMDQVSIYPLEAEDVCGLRIHGNAGACQMADEVLRGVVSSVCTRTITVNQPGVARFLVQEEGTSHLGEMTAKFQVYISLEKVHWEPLNEDIFEAAWKMVSHQNFQRVPLDGSIKDSTSAIGLIEEANKLFSALDESMASGQANEQQRSTNVDDEEDLYTAGELMVLSPSDQGTVSSNEVELLDTLQTSADGEQAAGGLLVVNDRNLGHATDLYSDEEAQLSLAIQFSMETTKISLADQEEEMLQKVLELSKKMVRHDGPAVTPTAKNQAVFTSLQDTIKAANTAQIFVFAGYSCDLIRVDIALGKKVTLRQVEEKLKHKGLSSLSEFHKRCVDVIKRKHAVEIKIQGTTATISGFKDYVNEALPDMTLLLKRISNSTSDADILRTVQWVWLDQATSTMRPYAPDVMVCLENAWKMKQKSIDILMNNQPHIINFEKMLECNVASGKSVPVSRKMLSSGDLFKDLPEEDYSQLSNMPEASRLDEESDEFQDVVKEFYDSIEKYHNKIRIIKVEKLMNKLLYNQYRLKKASISQSATEPEVEQTLFHGTSEPSAKEICVHGFNRSFCGKNATVYGQGAYFAVESSLSVQDQYSPPNAAGHKFVFVAKVLTGDFTKGSHEMKTAPLKESSDIPLRYDSVTDDPNKPSLFVIFNDTQAFPEYLITCQKIHR